MISTRSAYLAYILLTNEARRSSKSYGSETRVPANENGGKGARGEAEGNVGLRQRERGLRRRITEGVSTIALSRVPNEPCMD